MTMKKHHHSSHFKRFIERVTDILFRNLEIALRTLTIYIQLSYLKCPRYLIFFLFLLYLKFVNCKNGFIKII